VTVPEKALTSSDKSRFFHALSPAIFNKSDASQPFGNVKNPW